MIKNRVVTINQSANDGYANRIPQTWIDNSVTIRVGRLKNVYYDVGLLFLNGFLTHGMNIISAILKWKTASISVPFKCKILGWKSERCNKHFGNGILTPYEVEHTNEYVLWEENLPQGLNGFATKSKDVTNILNELINLSVWQSCAQIGFCFLDNGSASPATALIVAYDFGSSYPWLDITYKPERMILNTQNRHEGIVL